MPFFINLSVVIIVLSLTINLSSYIAKDEDDNADIVTIYSTTQVTKVQVQESKFQIPDEKWTTNALKEIAYYLRNHKFNEWDRRYYHEKPNNNLIGYFGTFPTPSLKPIHWKVYEHCYSNFYKCITYLYSIIETAPVSRKDDIVTMLNEKLISSNDSLILKVDTECRKSCLNTEKTGTPFDDAKEKFQWRTSASYFMCWYTMLETPALSMLGESCDNFAKCLDPKFGAKNHDPRSNDRLPFACAMYSFCPDICCPLKHVETITQCFEHQIVNPCFVENANGNSTETRCKMNRNDNESLNNIIANKWNVSCHCSLNGFKWNSQFGMCVDINECISGHHNCDKTTENCFNLPGTFQCVCKLGLIFDKNIKKCVNAASIMEINTYVKNHTSFMDALTILLKYLGF